MNDEEIIEKIKKASLRISFVFSFCFISLFVALFIADFYDALVLPVYFVIIFVAIANLGIMTFAVNGVLSKYLMKKFLDK